MSEFRTLTQLGLLSGGGRPTCLIPCGGPPAEGAEAVKHLEADVGQDVLLQRGRPLRATVSNNPPFGGTG